MLLVWDLLAGIIWVTVIALPLYSPVGQYVAEFGAEAMVRTANAYECHRNMLSDISLAFGASVSGCHVFD